MLSSDDPVLQAFVAASLISAPSLDDWPQWGGPAHDGASHEANWSSKGKPTPLWKARVGLGYSSFAVQGGRVYTLGYDPEHEQDVIHCFGADSGKELWRRAFAVEWPPHADELGEYPGTLTTPAVDGDFLFCSEREGWLRCLRTADGEVVWERNARKELRLDLQPYGFAASPMLSGERVLLNYGRMVAFDAKTGATVWRSKKDYGDAYSTPGGLVLDGKAHLAVFAGEGLAILAEEDGHERDFFEWKARDQVNAMTPVAFGARVFLSSGGARGCALVDFGGKKPKVAWESRVMRNSAAGAIAWDDHLYGFDGGALKCIDLEGKACWESECTGDALSIADGRLIFVTVDGELVVAEASPAGYHELARKQVLDRGAFRTVPVLADGRIYVRSQIGDVVACDHRSD